MDASTTQQASVVRSGRQRRIDLTRYVTAIAVLVSAAVHFQQYLAGYSDVSVIGPMFVLNAVGGVVIAIAVVAWRHWIPTFLAAGFGALTVAAYWYSVLFGLFGFKETVTTGWPVLVSEIAEYVAVVFGLAATVMLAGSRRAAVSG
jgi:hypothetical protein